MTPRDVDAMSDAEYRAFWRYQRREIRELRAAARRKR